VYPRPMFFRSYIHLVDDGVLLRLLPTPAGYGALPDLGVCPLMAGSGVRLRGGDGSQHLEMYLAGSEDLVVVLSLIFSRVLCVSWVEQLLCPQSDLPKAQPGYLCLESLYFVTTHLFIEAQLIFLD
jgi:hypothetical protein